MWIFSSSSRFNEDKKIKEGITLLVRREKNGKKIFKCWTCDKFGNYACKCSKREKNYKGKFKLERDRDRNCLYANEDEESSEKGQSESDDELRFFSIKEDDLEKKLDKKEL